MSRLRLVLIWLGSIGLLALAIAAWPAVRQYTGVAPPDQVDQPVAVAPSLAARYALILGVAHNAGNNPATLEAAKRAGADVIEIDVIAARGRLVAGRPQAVPWLAGLVFRGPTLAQSWSQANQVGAVKLDLKQSDDTFLNMVVEFLSTHPVSRRVLISSDSIAALTYLNEHVRGVELLFSVSNPDAMRTLRTDARLRSVLAGASVFQGLVSAELVKWAHHNHLMILAWTANDSGQINRLAGDGVDGITTSNLAVLRALRSK